MTQIKRVQHIAGSLLVEQAQSVILMHRAVENMHRRLKQTLAQVTIFFFFHKLFSFLFKYINLKINMYTLLSNNPHYECNRIQTWCWNISKIIIYELCTQFTNYFWHFFHLAQQHFMKPINMIYFQLKRGLAELNPVLSRIRPWTEERLQIAEVYSKLLIV